MAYFCVFFGFFCFCKFFGGEGEQCIDISLRKGKEREKKRERKKKEILKPAGLGTAGGEVEFKDPTKAVRLTVIVLYFMLYICLLNVCSTPFQYAKKSLSCQCDLHQDHNINRPRVYKGSLLDKLFIWQ